MRRGWVRFQTDAVRWGSYDRAGARLPRSRRHHADAAGGRRGDDRTPARRRATPSSLHASGRRARRVVEESRETIARALGCRPGEVVFTSGGTEADNLAVKGIYWSRRDADPRRTRVLSTAVEHHAVLDPLDWLAEHERRRGRAAAGRRAWPAARRRAAREHRARPGVGRPDHGDVGQQRGRHPPADRRGGRARARRTRSRSTPTPCRRSARYPSTSRRAAWTR